MARAARPLRAMLAALALWQGVATMPAQAADPLFPAASRIGLVPPPGMQPADGFTGFAGETGASITLTELPAAAYPETSAALARKPLPNGLEFGRPEPLTLADGLTGVLYKGRQTLGGQRYRKWAMIVKAPDLTALASVQVPEAASGVSDEAIDAALRSLRVRAGQGLEAEIAALPFAIGDRAGLRPIRTIMGSALMLTDGPLDVDETGRQPLLIVAASLGKAVPADRTAYARRLFDSFDAVLDKAITETRDLPDGRILVVGTGATKQGGAMAIRQIIGFANGGYVRIVCTAPAGLDFAARCDAVAASVRFPRP